MHPAHFWRLLALYGLQVGCVGLLVLSTALPALGQKFQGRDNFNFREFQGKPYYFGITLGFNTSRFRPTRSGEFFLSDSIRVVESIGGPGFNLGIVTNLKIGNYFDFRFLPTLSFTERTIEYERINNDISNRRISSVFVEFPFHLRYKSAPYKDKRLFVIAGVKYGFDVASDSRSRQAESLIKISPSDFAIEYGAGVQFFLPFFIFSPEIKISHGLGNTLIYNPGLEESRVIDKLKSRTITLSLHFEG